MEPERPTDPEVEERDGMGFVTQEGAERATAGMRAYDGVKDGALDGEVVRGKEERQPQLWGWEGDMTVGGCLAWGSCVTV